LKAAVATDVAIALALSWKPLVKSKNSAVTITTATMNNVLVIARGRLPSNGRRLFFRRLGHFSVLSVPGWCVHLKVLTFSAARQAPDGLDLTSLSDDCGQLR
jgi:hypothetical protein